MQLRLHDAFHFRRQVPIGPYIVDFAEKSKRLVIVDGSQHNEPEGLASDAKRDLYLQNNRYNVLRFWNVDIDTNMRGVIDTILLALEK